MALPSSNCSSALPTAIANRPAAYTILALLSLVALYALWTGALVTAAYSGGILGGSSCLMRGHIHAARNRTARARRWQWAGLSVYALVGLGSLVVLAQAAGLLAL